MGIFLFFIVSVGVPLIAFIIGLKFVIKKKEESNHEKRFAGNKSFVIATDLKSGLSIGNDIFITHIDGEKATRVMYTQGIAGYFLSPGEHHLTLDVMYARTYKKIHKISNLSHTVFVEEGQNYLLSFDVDTETFYFESYNNERIFGK